jgi:hypothetical protein
MIIHFRDNTEEEVTSIEFMTKADLWNYIMKAIYTLNRVHIYFISKGVNSVTRYGISADISDAYVYFNGHGLLDSFDDLHLSIESFCSWEEALIFIGDMTDGTELRYSNETKLIDDANDIISK